MPQSKLYVFTCMECGKVQQFTDDTMKLVPDLWAKINIQQNHEYIDEVLCKGCWTTFLWRCKERKNAK